MTIQANELRIGNTIQWLHEEHETFHNVDIEIISAIERYNKNPNDDIFSRGFWYAPIPLTPEVLLKCGLKKNSIKNPFFDIFSIDIGRNRELSVHNPGTPNEMVFITEEDGKQVKSIVVARNFDYDGKTYLHQIQNLYFALTGTELNYQP